MNDSSRDKSEASRVPYRMVEDQFILNYICDHNAYNKVKGYNLWKKMSPVMKDKKFNRSWHSLKERYRKCIIPHIDIYNLDKNKVAKLVKPFKDTEINPPRTKSTVFKSWQDRKYNITEDKKIIQFVLSEGGTVNGNELWRKLERKKVLPGRTWHSMRNRFLKVILKNLDALVDKETCRQIRKIVNGDLSFVVFSEEEEEEENKIFLCGKNDEKQQRSNVPLRDTYLQEKSVTLPSSECISEPSTSYLPKKKRRIVSSDSSDEDAKDELELSDDGGESFFIPRSVNSKVPVVLLERCDVKTDGKVATSSFDRQSCSSSATFFSGVAVSTIFSNSTVRLYEDCCCGDFVSPGNDDSVVSHRAPCGSRCKTLKASAKSPRRLSAGSRESTCSCKPSGHRCSTNSSGIIEFTPERERDVEIKSEPQETDTNSVIANREEREDFVPEKREHFDNYVEMDGFELGYPRESSGLTDSNDTMVEFLPESERGDEIQSEPQTGTSAVIANGKEPKDFVPKKRGMKFIMDPIYENFDNYMVVDGFKLELGPLPFPVVHPWD